MIPGIVLCFAFLVAQLAALHYIDRRLGDRASDTRQATPVPPIAQRTEEGMPAPDAGV
ncbi:hypothetical protein [Halomonas stenophila]|uniref:Uncharacterized protein n=1 Tax=Halomonas stenophila TaxID=795312 RepID=A0A7W5EWN1_9GAMM|nr:hypothetical protein [Halomonas stenophila]MBB3232803.1 hypothetical protein [Halomonas stenophila]